MPSVPRTPWTRAIVDLPDPAGGRGDHRVPGLAGEGALELGHVRDDAVGPVTARRMRVGQGTHPRRLIGDVLAPGLRPAEEEPLLGREAIDHPAAGVGGPRRL